MKNLNNTISLDDALLKLDELSKQFHQADDDWLYEDIELNAIKLIAEYCRHNNLTEVANRIDEFFVKAEEDLDAYDELFDLIENTEKFIEVNSSYIQLRDYFIQKFWP
jgi:hypothetical protein